MNRLVDLLMAVAALFTLAACDDPLLYTVSQNLAAYGASYGGSAVYTPIPNYDGYSQSSTSTFVDFTTGLSGGSTCGSGRVCNAESFD